MAPPPVTGSDAPAAVPIGDSKVTSIAAQIAAATTTTAPPTTATPTATLAAQNDLLLRSYTTLRHQFTAQTSALHGELAAVRHEHARVVRELQWTVRKLREENGGLQREIDGAREQAVMVLALERQLAKCEAANARASASANANAATAARSVASSGSIVNDDCDINSKNPLVGADNTTLAPSSTAPMDAQRLRDLEQAQVALNTAYAQSLAHNDTLTADKLQLQRDIDALHTALATSAEDHERERREWQAQVDELKRDMERVRVDAQVERRDGDAEVERWMEAARGQVLMVGALRRENAELAGELEQMRLRHVTLSGELEQMRRRHVALSGELERIRQRSSVLASSVAVEDDKDTAEARSDIVVSAADAVAIRRWIAKHGGDTLSRGNNPAGSVIHDVRAIVDGQARQVELLRAENERLLKLIATARPMLSSSSSSSPSSLSSPSKKDTHHKRPANDILFLRNDAMAAATDTLGPRDLRRELERMRVRVETLQMQYEQQVKINEKIRRLIAQATAVGVPRLDVQLPVDEVAYEDADGDSLDSARPPVEPTLVTDTNKQQRGDAPFAFTDNPAAIKNHIQLIDMYNHALKTIARQSADLLESRRAVAKAEKRRLWQKEMPEDMDVVVGEPYQEVLKRTVTAEIDGPVTADADDPVTTGDDDVGDNAATTVTTTSISGTPATQIPPLLGESRFFEFGYCSECRHHMMINI